MTEMHIIGYGISKQLLGRSVANGVWMPSMDSDFHWPSEASKKI